VSVLDWREGGGTGAVIAELVSGRGGATADLAWSEDGRQLQVLGGRTGSEVQLWDVGERRVIGRVEDERAYGGKVLRKSRDGEYTAIGWVFCHRRSIVVRRVVWRTLIL
jgi:U3 small nucleolar RNA-associated protein 18